MARDIYQELTDQFLTLLDEHGSDWKKPWTTMGLNGLPKNAKTKKPYRGINILALLMSGHTSPYWGTYKQWNEIGGQVMKGSKATGVVLFKRVDKKDKDGKKDGSYMLIRSYNVFNLDQVEGVELSDLEEMTPEFDGEAEHDEAVEQWISLTGAEIKEVEGDRAFYTPEYDHICMPHVDQFHNTEGYYGTKLHELVHWTGHKSRLDRLGGNNRFGSEDYAKEELVAEMGSMFLCNILGVSEEPREDHAKYVNSWRKALKDDKTYLPQAASAAQKACDHLQELVEAQADTEAAA